MRFNFRPYFAQIRAACDLLRKAVQFAVASVAIHRTILMGNENTVYDFA